MPLLSETEIMHTLKVLPGWTYGKHSFAKTFTFTDFRDALAFANRVGGCAEALDHHPMLHIEWGKVVVTLSTHTENGVTEKDVTLASEIEKL